MLRYLLLMAMFMAQIPLASKSLAQDSPQPVATEPHQLVVVIAARGSGILLERVEVQVADSMLYSDADGRVSVTIPPGDGQILISHFGYEKALITYSELRLVAEHRVFLLPAQPNDEVIVIRGNRRPEVSRKTISVEETRRIAPGGDPAQIAVLMPGVQSNGFSPEVIIRGSGPEDSGYYVDQLAVPFIFHRIGNISIIPDQLISDVQFSSGGFSSQYGEATGGIIVLRTTSEIPERAKTDALVNIPFYSGVYHERPLSKDTAVAVSARLSTLQYIIPAVIPKGLDTTVVPYFGDAHVRYLKKVDGGHDKFLTTFSRDGISLAVPAGESSSEDGRLRFEYIDTFVGSGWEYYRSLGSGWTIRTTPQVFYTENSIDVGDIYFKGDFLNFLNPVEFGKRIDKDRSFYAGLDAQAVRFDLDVKAPQFVQDDPFFDVEEAPTLTVKRKGSGYLGGAWAQIDTAVGPVILTPGLRVFYNSLIGSAGVDPRLSSRYDLSSDLQLKGAIGQYSISPEPQESSAEFGNPDLGFERSHHYIAGLEKKWGDRWTAEIQGFHKKTYNVIFSDPVTRYNGSGLRVTDGLELFLRRNMTERTFGWLTYTFSKSREKESEAEKFGAASYDQAHIVNLVGSYKISAEWDFGLRLKYNSGNPYTPIKSAVYNANLDKYQPISMASDLNSRRIPDQHSADIFATKVAFYDTWKLSHRFGLSGVAAKPQVSGVTYNYDYSKRRYFTGLPMVPFYEIRGEF